MNRIEKEQPTIDRILEKQKEHNKRSKDIAKIFGANLTLYICIMIPAILIGFIWTDTDLPKIGWGLLCDGILTVFLFFLAEYSMIQLGISGGKLDDEYNKYHEEYLELTVNVRKMGTALMYPFCDWQIDLEYHTFVKERLRAAKIPYKEWENSYSKMSIEELKQALGIKKAAQVAAINAIDPIELTPDMILTDGRGKSGRGGVVESGEDYIDRKKKSWQHILIGAFTAVFTVSVALTLTQDISFTRVLYTFVKLIALFFRMSSGYNAGAKAYNTIEVRHIQSKIALEHAYIEYVEKKFYLNFGDKYGDVTEYLPKEEQHDSREQENIKEDGEG